MRLIFQDLKRGQTESLAQCGRKCSSFRLMRPITLFGETPYSLKIHDGWTGAGGIVSVVSFQNFSTLIF